ncbi:hypothetical protein ACHAWF_001143 [Thalassiosira exigua]
MKIEPEAILFVLDTARSSLPCRHRSHPPLKPPSAARLGSTAGDLPLPLSVPLVGATHDPADEDDCPGLRPLDSDEISLSTCESLSSCSARIPRRRVSFAAPLVTAVKTRPRTKDSDKELLFYTRLETDRDSPSFRQVYREEKQSLPLNVEDPGISDPSPSDFRRRISRVVVEHNDSHETFYDFNGSSTSLHERGGGMNDIFFDSDSFWSGSITWY